MKTLTPYLLKFALFALFLAIAFRYLLSYGIENQSKNIIIISAVLYALSMFVIGLYYGIKDGDYLPILDVGFRFHLTTYLVHNSISELWFLLDLNSSYEKVRTIHMTAIYWGIFLFIHFIFYLWIKRKSINGLDKTDLFE